MSFCYNKYYTLLKQSLQNFKSHLHLYTHIHIYTRLRNTNLVSECRTIVNYRFLSIKFTFHKRHCLLSYVRMYDP